MALGQSLTVNGKTLSTVSSYIAMSMGPLLGAEQRIHGLIALTYKHGTDGDVLKGANGPIAWGNGAYAGEGSIELIHESFIDYVQFANQKNSSNGFLEVPCSLVIWLAERFADPSGLAMASSSIELPSIVIYDDDIGTGFADGQKALTHKMAFKLMRPVMYDGMLSYPDAASTTRPYDVALSASISLGLL